LFAFGRAPAAQKVVQGSELGLQSLLNLVLKQDAVILGNKLAIRIKVLRALYGDAHIHIANDVLSTRFVTALPTFRFTVGLALAP
jgi:hypothetical protein